MQKVLLWAGQDTDIFMLNPTDSLNVLILSHNIWTGHSTWEQNCILIYPIVKCVPGHILKHDENNPQLCCEFQVHSTTSGYF